MHMERKAKVIIIVWSTIVIWVAWLAREPNPFALQTESSTPVHSYYWEYPAVFLALGVISYLLLGLWRPGHSFVRALTTFGLFALLLVVAVLGSMHAPPVHWYAILILFGGCLSLLFYSGYVLGRHA